MHTDPSSPRGQLLSKYVLARITNMDGVDIGLFDFDRHNALYYFVLNADEQIYLRYGGRDETSPEAYLNLQSLELALNQGLEEHRRYVAGEHAKTARPKPFFPRDIPSLKTFVIDQGRCVECHLIADYRTQELALDGVLDKVRDVFVYPDIKRIGIELDIPRGLIVKEATGPVAEAGMKAGDRIASIEGARVLTFGDLQHYYNKVERDAEGFSLTVVRGDSVVPLRVALPQEWWYSDLYHRYLSVDPVLYFTSRALSAEDKEYHGLDPRGFASVVEDVDPAAQVYKLHTLKPGDIVYSVDGVEADDFTRNIEIYIKLNTHSGDRMRLGVIRDGARMEMDARSFRQDFRKPQW